ncbi:MAG: NUDIX domain-containing protein, partial [Acidimicrobiales bacterium]
MTVPALPAASLVVIDDRPDLHVLLGRRRPGAFVGDMIVYPGGAVDDDDWRLGPALVPGATAPGLSAVDAAAYLHAAIRETREEVGLFPDPNEVHDGTAFAAVGHWTTPEEVRGYYSRMIDLMRQSAPDAACLAVAPIDAA